MFQDFLWLVVGSPWPALHSLLWMLVVMTLTLSRPVIADGASDSMGMVLQRVNYGVMFKENANLILTQENWLHTFHIVLPKRVKPTSVSRCSDNTSMCHVINNMSMFLHALHVETYHHLSTTLSAIKTLIPQTNLIKNKRKTRSLLPFIGSLSKGLFGTATMDDVNMLAGHINELNRRTSKLALAMEQHGKRLSSFMSLMDNRTSNLIEGLKVNSLKIDALARTFSKNLIQVEYAMSNISVIMLQQVTKATNVRSTFDKLLSATESLIEGKISPFLIPKGKMNSVIGKINQILQKSYKGFFLTHTDPSFFYSNAQFVYARSYSNIYITIKFPISAHKLPLQLYKVISLPVPVNRTSSHATQLLSLPSYIAVTNHHDHFVSLEPSQLVNCVHGKTILCNFNIPLTPITVPDCTMAIFANNVKQVHKLCDFRFVPHLLKPNIIELSPTSVLLYNIKNIALDCPEEKKVIPGCAFCIFTVPCKCSLSTSTLYYAPRLVDCYKSPSNLTTLHPLNLALLQHFFDDTKLGSLFGDTTFPSPINLSVPQFRIYNHSFNEVLANDKKFHLSLRKMSEAARNDQVIFSNLAEPLIDGEITIPDDWPDTNAIMIFVTMGVATISLIFCVYSFCKMRKMATALLVLQQTAKARSATLPSFIYDSKDQMHSIETDMSNTLKLELSYTHAIIAICCFVFVVLATCAIIVYRSKRTQGTTLLLEMTSGGYCATVPLVHLNLCPSYWHISKPTIKNLDISSFPWCKLYATWSPFLITNKASGQTIHVPSTVTVSWFTYYKLSRIFQQPFCAYVLVTHQGFYSVLNKGNTGISCLSLDDI